MTAVAIVARGHEVPAARVLARSLAAFVPGAQASVLVLPGLRPEMDREREPFAIVTPRDLGMPVADRLLGAAPLGPLAALMRPLLAAHLLERGAGRVLVLAPDAEVHGALDPWLEALERHPAVLVPRLTGRLPDDDRRPDGRDLLEAGGVDDALVALRDDDAGRALLAWWTERALEAAESAASLGSAGAAQHTRLGASPLDAAGTVFEGLGRLEDPGVGVSYWNLHERALAGAPDGITAAAAPLRLMRWHGFRPDRPWWLSEHATRVLVLDDPVLSGLVNRRAAALREAGWLRPEDLDAAAGELTGGVRYDARLRTLHAEAADAGESFGDIFTPAGADAFLAWLSEPAPRGGANGVNRYAHAAWREREDVRTAYPDLDGADAEGFLGWLWVHGRAELGLQDALLPAPPPWVEERSRHVPPVLITGYLRGTLGLGQAARGYAGALTAAGVPVATRTVATDPPVERLPRGAVPRPEEQAFAELELPAGVVPEANLVCVNADQLPGFAEEAGEETSAAATRSGSGRGRPTSSPSAGTVRSSSSTSCGSTRPTWPSTSRAPATCRSSSCRSPSAPPTRPARRCRSPCPTGSCSCSCSTSSPRSSARTRSVSWMRSSARSRPARARRWSSRRSTRASAPRRTSGCATRSATAPTSTWSTRR